jgi:hypothetical protein
MGLTIHYDLQSDADSPEQARKVVERLRQAALDLAMADVGEIVEREGPACDFSTAARDDPNLWMLVQARRLIPVGKTYTFATPERMIAFSAWPGEGCEVANLGLAVYPQTIRVAKKKLNTGLSGWSWASFCKTQYASNPEAGGIANFVRCHLTVVRLLDRAKEMGVLAAVKDESNFWENRDVKALAETVGQWNTGLAGLAGLIKDQFPGKIIDAPITQFPNFEHLEAEGRVDERGE